jgi:hypothetical protein
MVRSTAPSFFTAILPKKLFAEKALADPRLTAQGKVAVELKAFEKFWVGRGLPSGLRPAASGKSLRAARIHSPPETHPSQSDGFGRSGESRTVMPLRRM